MRKKMFRVTQTSSSRLLCSSFSLSTPFFPLIIIYWILLFKDVPLFLSRPVICGRKGGRKKETSSKNIRVYSARTYCTRIRLYGFVWAVNYKTGNSDNSFPAFVLWWSRTPNCSGYGRKIILVLLNHDRGVLLKTSGIHIRLPALLLR